MIQNNILAISNGNRSAFNEPFLSGVSAAGTFTRASSQWLVNDSGVLTEFTSGIPATNSKGYLSEPASTNKVTCYSALTESLGSELVTNGSFADSTGWTLSAGFSVGSGTLNASSAASGNSAYYNAGIVIGRAYQVTYTITSLTAGAFRPLLGSVYGATRSTTGTFTDIIIGTGSADPYVYIKAYGTTTGSIDNLSVKEIYNGVGTKATASSTTAIRGMTLGSATNTVAEIKAETTLLPAAGLGSITNARVVEVDNVDAGAVTITFAGTAGNTNPHSGGLYIAKISGAGTPTLGINATTANVMAATMTKVKVENATPASGSNLVLTIPAGVKVQFIQPDFVEATALSSPIVTQGATNTRAATVLSYPTAGIFTTPMSGTFYWTPSSIKGSTEYLWGSYLDSNNSIGLLYDGTNVVFRKRVGGTNFDATKALTAVAGTKYKIGWRINQNYSIDVFVNSVRGTGSADTHAPAATTTFQLGLDGNSANGAVSSQIRDFKIYRKALPDTRL